MTIVISLAIALLMMTGITVYLIVTIRDIQQRFNRERDWVREDHIRALLDFTKEYGRVVRRGHAWKIAAKKYYKEALDVRENG